MSLKVIKPTWQQVTSGLALDREGTVLLEFAKGENRKYDWDRKEVGGCWQGCVRVRAGRAASAPAPVVEQAVRNRRRQAAAPPHGRGRGTGPTRCPATRRRTLR